jgi:hypothetical protein
MKIIGISHAFKLQQSNKHCCTYGLHARRLSDTQHAIPITKHLDVRTWVYTHAERIGQRTKGRVGAVMAETFWGLVFC